MYELPSTVRSIRRGTLGTDEALALTALFRDDPLANVTAGIVRDIADYAPGDIYFHDGDLHLPGDYASDDANALVLIVRGNLTVDGVYCDTLDPDAFTLVTGNLRANAAVTAGFLEVHGDLVVRGSLIGDYNDGSAYIAGNVRCGLFYPENHHFTVLGDLEAGTAIGAVKHRVSGEGCRPADIIGLDDARLLDLFDHELLRPIDMDGRQGVDGFRFPDLVARVLAGQPVKRGVAA